MPVGRSCVCRQRSDLDGKSQVLQAGNEAVDLLALAASIEVMRAEVVIEGSCLQHLVDGSEDRGSDGANRLFGAAAGAQAMKLRLQVAGLLAGGGPGAL